MPRYLVAATLIVIGGIFVMLGLRDLGYLDPKPELVSTRVSQSDSPDGGVSVWETARPTAGDAPWALSALPECFHQIRELRGTSAVVRSQQASFAPGPWMAAENGMLKVADCRVRVDDTTTIAVDRGATHLTIPAKSALFVAGKTLVLVRTSDEGKTFEERAYTLHDGETPFFGAP